MKVAGLAGSFWPTLQQELLLRAAFSPPEQTAHVWARLRPELNLDVLDEGSTQLLPLLYQNLCAAGVDDPDLPKLKGAYRRTWFANQVLVNQVQPVLADLRQAGIDLLLLPGASLAADPSTDLGLRRLPNVELLVRPQDLVRAASILERAKFVSVAPVRATANRPLAFVGPDGQVCILDPAPPVDLLVPGKVERSAQDWWDAAVAGQLGGAAVALLSSADELLFSCVTGARPVIPARIDWIADSLRIIARPGSAINWARLRDQAAKRRMTLRLRAALVYLAALGAGVPDGFIASLDATTVTRRDVIAHGLSARTWGPLGGFPQTLAAYMRLSAPKSFSRAAIGLPRFLMDVWELEHVWQLPPAVCMKMSKVLAGSLRGRRPRPTTGDV